VAAILAARYAKPVFDQYLRDSLTPPVQLGAVVIETVDHQQPVSEGDTAKVKGLKFWLQVVIQNTGPATIRNAVLNIRVPRTCVIEVLDDPSHGHYILPLPADDMDIRPGQRTLVNMSRAERDFPPGNFHVYAVAIDTRVPGRWPVLVVLDGDPRVSRTLQFTIETAY
jgi:hypothetical protein